MKLTRYKAPSTIELLRREMDSLFDDMAPFSFGRNDRDKRMDMWAPSSDIAEDDNEYLVTIDLPGMEKSDIKVNYQDGRLTITGERKIEESDEKKNVIRNERYYGSFYRSFTLPEAVKEDEIKASFREGVLKVTIPKSEVKEPKNVQVE